MVDIVATDGTMGGEPRIAGRRVSVLQVAELVREAGHDPAYVADQLDLTLAEVHTALAYFYEHPEEMDAIRERHRELEETLAEVAAEPQALDQ